MNLVTQDVTVRYGAQIAVDKVELTAEPGELQAIRRRVPQVVAAPCPGQGAGACRAHRLGRRLYPRRQHRYMPQDSGTRVALKAFERVLLGRMRWLPFRVGRPDLEATEAAMAEIGVEDLAPRHIGELSGGQRQVVLLAQMLAGDPRVLLLDDLSPRRAMPLDAFIAEVMDILTRQPDATEVIVERCKPLRFAAEDYRMSEMVEMINSIAHCAGPFQDRRNARDSALSAWARSRMTTPH